MKNVKKLLAAQAKDVLPDDQVKNEIKQRLGYTQTEREYALEGGGTKAEHNGKKGLITAAAAILALALCFIALLPLLLNQGKSGNLNNKFNKIETTQDFYMYGAASVGSLLATSPQVVSTPRSIRYNTLSLPTAAQSDEDGIKKTVNGYMPLIENLLAEGDIEYKTENTPKDDVYAEYPFRSVITYRELCGNAESFTLYYKKTLTANESSDSEKEEEFDLNGILLVNGSAFPVIGESERSQETEQGESETEDELTFIAYREIGEKRVPYIQMTQETSVEQENGQSETEKSFAYTYYDEYGKRQQKTVVEYEQEGNEYEVLLSIENGTKKDTLQFGKKDNFKNVLTVEGSVNGKSVSFTVTIKTNDDGHNDYVYDFTDQNTDGNDEDDD